MLISACDSKLIANRKRESYFHRDRFSYAMSQKVKVSFHRYFVQSSKRKPSCTIVLLGVSKCVVGHTRKTFCMY